MITRPRSPVPSALLQALQSLAPTVPSLPFSWLAMLQPNLGPGPGCGRVGRGRPLAQHASPHWLKALCCPQAEGRAQFPMRPPSGLCPAGSLPLPHAHPSSVTLLPGAQLPVCLLRPCLRRGERGASRPASLRGPAPRLTWWLFHVGRMGRCRCGIR